MYETFKFVHILTYRLRHAPIPTHTHTYTHTTHTLRQKGQLGPRRSQQTWAQAKPTVSSVPGICDGTPVRGPCTHMQGKAELTLWGQPHQKTGLRTKDCWWLELEPLCWNPSPSGDPLGHGTMCAQPLGRWEMPSLSQGACGWGIREGQASTACQNLCSSL